MSCNKTEPQSSDTHFFTTALKQFQVLQNSSSAMPTRRDMCRSQPKHALGTLGKTKHAHAKSRSTKHAHAKSCSRKTLMLLSVPSRQHGTNWANITRRIFHTPPCTDGPGVVSLSPVFHPASESSSQSWQEPFQALLGKCQTPSETHFSNVRGFLHIRKRKAPKRKQRLFEANHHLFQVFSFFSKQHLSPIHPCVRFRFLETSLNTVSFHREDFSGHSWVNSKPLP